MGRVTICKEKYDMTTVVYIMNVVKNDIENWKLTIFAFALFDQRFVLDVVVTRFAIKPSSGNSIRFTVTNYAINGVYVSYKF